MKGRQFSYFVTPKDWSAMLTQLGALEIDIYTKIYHDDLRRAKLTVSQAESSEAIAFCLTNAGNGSIFASPFGAAAGKVNQYIIDVNESEVVEVYRSFVGVEEGRRIIRRARMYYVPKLYVDGVARSKSEGFVAHSARIFRFAKKFLLRDVDGQYYGPEARELKSMGETKFVI